MKIRREGLLVPERTTPPVDLDLFETFQAAHLDKTAAYTEMSVTGERKEKALVELARGENVDLTIQDSDPARLQERLQALRAWKHNLLQDKSLDPELKQAYRWKVNENIANIHMLEASHSGDMARFRRWNEFIYGKPNEAVYRAALDWVAHDAELLLEKPDQKPAIAEAAQTVLSLLESERGDRELLVPDAAIFDAVRRDQLQPGGYFDLLLDGADIPREGKITKEIGNVALRHIITNNLKSDYGLRPSKTGDWSVNHADGYIEYPENYSLVPARFIGLPVGHETGQHYLEKINGLQADVRLIGSGLDRTEWGNESTAIVREMSQYETFADFAKTVRWRDILRREICIGYGHGIGAEQPRSSQQIMSFMSAIDRMYQSKLTPNDADATDAKTFDKTSKLLIRTLRGVDGSQGGVYLKDKVYLEGHVATWQTLAAKGPQALDDSTLGKYDINNSRHIVFLQNKGILPRI